MASTDINGSPLLILGHVDALTLHDMLQRINSDERTPDQERVLNKIDAFVVECGSDKSK